MSTGHPVRVGCMEVDMPIFRKGQRLEIGFRPDSILLRLRLRLLSV